MGNIIDYIREYGEYSLPERPFCDEDALVLAQFSYLKLEEVLPEAFRDTPGVTVGEIAHMAQLEAVFADERFARSNRALFEGMRTSRRFQTMRIRDCVSRTDREKQLQFAAMTCILEDGSVYIAFRGTDETLVGWKEDFYMACRAPVPSQEMSRAYLDEAAGRCRGGVMLGGHSKGGNLAVYAAAHCRAQIRSRIRRIYSLDGPGFLPSLRAGASYREIEGRIRKLVPRSSVVGMLLEDHGTYETVESNTFGLLQHNPFSWIIREGRFVKADDIYKGRKTAVEILNRWIGSVGEEEREIFINDFFSVIEASRAETLLDLSGNWNRALGEMAAALKDTDADTRKEFFRIGRALLAAGREVAAEHLREYRRVCGKKKNGNRHKGGIEMADRK